jgi:hypothetical protein
MLSYDKFIKLINRIIIYLPIGTCPIIGNVSIKIGFAGNYSKFCILV